MKLNKLLLLSLASASLFFSGCTNNADETTTTTSNSEYKFDLGKDVKRAFKGTVVDQNNNPLANVSVKINGNTTTTDASGIFTFSNITVKERFAYFVSEKAGFINGSRTLMTHESLNILKIMMLPATVVKTIQTGVTSDVLVGNTKITFDGSFSTENGTVYNGAVKVIMNDLKADDTNVFTKMPGTLLGVNEQGEYRGMETFGMVNVELRGSNNEKLQLTAGHPAQMVMAISPVKQSVAPAKMPLWFFDEATGLWKEEGYSTKVGNNYVGSLNHFTWWNNDSAYTVAQLTVVSLNSDGTIAQGVRCTVTRMTGSSGDILMELGITGTNGTLTVGVPRNEEMTFRAYSANGELIDERILPSSSAMTRTITVIIGVLQR